MFASNAIEKASDALLLQLAMLQLARSKVELPQVRGLPPPLSLCLVYKGKQEKMRWNSWGLRGKHQKLRTPQIYTLCKDPKLRPPLCIFWCRATKSALDLTQQPMQSELEKENVHAYIDVEKAPVLL